MRAGIFAAFILLLAAALLLLVFGPITYVREAREFRPEPVAAAGPETIRVGELQPGQAVNLEVDLIARYLERLLEARSDGV